MNEDIKATQQDATQTEKSEQGALAIETAQTTGRTAAHEYIERGGRDGQWASFLSAFEI